MKCIHPRVVKNPRNGHYIEVPCTKCPACLHNKQKEWAFRLMMEQKYSNGHSYFVTLTFDDNLVDSYYTQNLDKKFFSDFIKRLRRKLEYHNITKEFRFFGCGEYGDLGRAHYHFICFGIPLNRIDFNTIIGLCWPFGFVTVSDVTDARCMYVAKYTCKELFANGYEDKKQKPFASISSGRKPGVRGNVLGCKFLKDESLISRIKKEQMFYVRSSNGSLFNLPRYYRNRIFSAYEVDLHSDFVSKINTPVFSNYLEGKKYFDNLILQENYYESQFFKHLSDERKNKLGIK